MRIHRCGLRRSKGNSREPTDYELGVIESMGFSDYFLIVWDFIAYCHSTGHCHRTGPRIFRRKPDRVQSADYRC